MAKSDSAYVRWTVAANLSALTALKNNRDHIYRDQVTGNAVLHGAQSRAIERSDQVGCGLPVIGAADVAGAMAAAGLAFRCEEYICTLVPWERKPREGSANWGE